MAALDPNLDFRDDGGTPGWRARQPRVVIVEKRTWRGELKKISLIQWAMLIIACVIMFPWGILLIGLLGAGLFDAIMGR